MAEDGFALGVDVGGTSVKAALITADGEVVPGTFRIFDPESTKSAHVILGHFGRALKELIQAGPRAVGLAFPGPFDYVRGISQIRGLGKYDDLYGRDLTRDLHRVLHLGTDTPLRFLNDAVAFGLGEAHFGAARGLRRVLCVTLGTGCGSVFLVDGAVVTEGQGLPPHGWLYSLPYKGSTLDEVLSRRGLLHLWASAQPASTDLDAADLAARASMDPVAAAVFVRFGEVMADALAPIVLDFAADAVVVGGRLAKSAHLFLPALRRGLAQRGLTTAALQAQDIDGAAVRGAAVAALPNVSFRPHGTERTDTNPVGSTTALNGNRHDLPNAERTAPDAP